jgi:hypothetical protein
MLPMVTCSVPAMACWMSLCKPGEMPKTFSRLAAKPELILCSGYWSSGKAVELTRLCSTCLRELHERISNSSLPSQDDSCSPRRLELLYHVPHTCRPHTTVLYLLNRLRHPLDHLMARKQHGDALQKSNQLLRLHNRNVGNGGELRTASSVYCIPSIVGFAGGVCPRK